MSDLTKYSEEEILLSHKGRCISDRETLKSGYCGSASMEIHRSQLGDPDSWVHSSMSGWIQKAKPKPNIEQLQAELAEYKDALAEKFSDVCKTCMNVFFPKLQAENKRLKTIDSMFKEMYPKRYLIVEGAVEFAEQALKDTT